MKITYIICFCFFIQHLTGQITTSREWNSDKGEYKIIAENDYPGHRVVKVTFDYLSGVCKDGNKSFLKTVRPGKSTITTIKSTGGLSSQRPDFRYKYVSYSGRIDKEPVLDYPYLIPVSHGKKTEVKLHSYLGKSYGNFDPPKNFYSLQFMTTSGDTIYASRRGTIIEVEDNKALASETNISFSRNKNTVSIQHKDGTTAYYKNFKNGGIFTQIGEVVNAGDPIGIIGGENYENGSHLSFSVSYYEEHPKTIEGKETGEYYYNAYVPVDFHSVDGVLKFEHCNTIIEAIHDDEIISYEMSKREKKKWKKLKGK
jgi:hypothetical protein